MLKIAVLGSTRGTSTQTLLDAQVTKQLGNAEIVLVVSNTPEAGILDKARAAGVEAVYLAAANREDFEHQLLNMLQRRKVDLILLIGFMWILSPRFIQQWRNKILNIHPSLLPKYAGGMNLDVHAEVLKHGDKVTGCTLHYVTADVDAGPILMQQEVAVLPNDTPETLKTRVQAAEQEVILQAIHQLANS